MNGFIAKRTGAAIGDLVAAATALTLIAAVTPPGLTRLREKYSTAACANNLRINSQAFGVYAEQFNNTWIAPWDYDLLEAEGLPIWSSQWPYTMRIYTQGLTIGDGMPVYWHTGWWSPKTKSRSDLTPHQEGYESPCMQCPGLVGTSRYPFYVPITTYSYFIPQRLDDTCLRSKREYYPKPDLMTHPATTIHLHDAYRMPGEECFNMWSLWNLEISDPHFGRSNYLFADGHVNLLAGFQTHEWMWRDQWLPEDPDSVDGWTGK